MASFLTEEVVVFVREVLYLDKVRLEVRFGFVRGNDILFLIFCCVLT